VTEAEMSAETVRGASPQPLTAGALLVQARKAAGLTVDAVAQQLKLAPRQVRSLEEDDYTHLPGRTFVRGFVRSYARLVHLDPEAVLDALPAGAAEPALEAPALQQTAPTMGELPLTDHSKPAWTRWAIPLTLAAIVAAAAVYEWLRSGGEAPAGIRGDAPVAVEQPAPPTRPERSGTALPNPLAASTAPAAAPSTEPAPAKGDGAVPAEQPLVLSFRDTSWTEVRDRDGRVLLSGMNPGGTVQTLSGVPPLELVIGNAADVELSYRGQPFDLAPHTRQNVARLTLP
jgi:cytoskeleton protein RodZ